jgi:YegS/Rv2252/BmrU family lipid kinase
MLKKKIRFIVNPFSGPKKSINIDQLIQTLLNKEAFDYELIFTEYAGHAHELSCLAAEQQYYAVIAVGGDGTINEVASSLVNTKTALGVIPFGSGNGFAYHIGLRRDVAKAIKAINTCNTIKIDSATINGIFFINVAGLGLDAKVAFLTKKNRKRGFLPYFIQTIRESRQFTFMDLTLSTEEKSWNGQYAMATVANGSMYGYDFSIAPAARLNDGLFDVILIKKAPIYRYISLAVRMYFRNVHHSSLVEYFTCKTLHIQSQNANYFHVDGEGNEAISTDFSFAIIPDSLHLLTEY